eukprot:gnl/Dysnectes_brevis/4359_a5822_399.p1 GENE.gnl/Dysnectes_brevis/4359_a5822_399~~gnl/Dysnectes_brevis/4359_a5822_399.p1  ORF type:complete len:661 (+),score=120.98 gnl/Dysnectes_brevis/4359_a5822_399:86-2068(+)
MAQSRSVLLETTLRTAVRLKPTLYLKKSLTVDQLIQHLRQTDSQGIALGRILNKDHLVNACRLISMLSRIQAPSSGARKGEFQHALAQAWKEHAIVSKEHWQVPTKGANLDHLRQVLLSLQPHEFRGGMPMPTVSHTAARHQPTTAQAVQRPMPRSIKAKDMPRHPSLSRFFSPFYEHESALGLFHFLKKDPEFTFRLKYKVQRKLLDNTHQVHLFCFYEMPPCPEDPGNMEEMVLRIIPWRKADLGSSVTVNGRPVSLDSFNKEVQLKSYSNPQFSPPPLDITKEIVASISSSLGEGKLAVSAPPKTIRVAINDYPFPKPPSRRMQQFLQPPSPYVVVYLARVKPNHQLVKDVQERGSFTLPRFIPACHSAGLIHPDKALAFQGQHSQDDGIEDAMESIALVDPMTLERIKVPARGEHCAHPRAFDLGSYLNLAQKTGVWNCPLCDKPSPFARLKVDVFLQYLVDNYPSLESVKLDPTTMLPLQMDQQDQKVAAGGETEGEDSEGSDWSFSDDAPEAKATSPAAVITAPPAAVKDSPLRVHPTSPRDGRLPTRVQQLQPQPQIMRRTMRPTMRRTMPARQFHLRDQPSQSSSTTEAIELSDSPAPNTNTQRRTGRRLHHTGRARQSRTEPYPSRSGNTRSGNAQIARGTADDPIELSDL